MWQPSFNAIRTSPLLLATALASGIFLAGCDEHVDVVRDHSVRIAKHATWAWKPAESAHRSEVVSRDVISRRGHETISRDPRVDNDTFRLEVRTDIEQTLSEKGFKQVSDPQSADFLVDYHAAVRRHTFNSAGYGPRRDYDRDEDSYRRDDDRYDRRDGRDGDDRDSYRRDDDYDREDYGYRVGYPGGYSGWVCGPFGCSYGWGYGGPYGYRNFGEGTIVFDFVQRESGKIAFRAVAHKRMDHNSFHANQVRDAIERLLRDLRHGK